MSRIRTNLITNRMANGAPTVSNGLVISGVTTSTNVTTAIDAIIKNTVHDCELQILATYSNKNSKLLFGDAADDDVGIIDYDHNTNNMHFTVNAGERLRITSAGSVGINSTSPDRRFTIHQDATCRMNLKSLANSTAGIEFGDEADHNAGYVVYDNTDNSMQFGVNAGERVRIDSSGQFALGRTGQITANGNQSTSVFEQLSNNNYPLALHSAQTNNRGLAIFYATTGTGNAGDPFIVCTDNTNNKFQVTSDGTITNRGNILPAVNNSKDLGSSSLRWANLYTQDLQLSNEAKKDTGGNSVDGTWGDWTLQEGESDVFMINNRNGKKYMFMLKEVV